MKYYWNMTLINEKVSQTHMCVSFLAYKSLQISGYKHVESHISIIEYNKYVDTNTMWGTYENKVIWGVLWYDVLEKM